MALIEQWRSTRPWFVDGLAALAGGALGLGALFPFIAPASQGTLAAPRDHAWEHPLRKRILNTLERSPGIHYRELQRQLDAANGTLRHHLDVLINERTVTIMPVNGRTCYYAGAPAQVEILAGSGVTDQSQAAAMLPVGLSTVQRNIVTRLSKTPVAGPTCPRYRAVASFGPLGYRGPAPTRYSMRKQTSTGASSVRSADLAG